VASRLYDILKIAAKGKAFVFAFEDVKDSRAGETVVQALCAEYYVVYDVYGKWCKNIDNGARELDIGIRGRHVGVKVVVGEND
jgi:hypothetical protein